MTTTFTTDTYRFVDLTLVPAIAQSSPSEGSNDWAADLLESVDTFVFRADTGSNTATRVAESAYA